MNLKTSASVVLLLLLGFAASAADAAFPGKVTQWMGQDRHDFDFNGKTATVVVPKEPLPGKPWAWRGEFFGAFAEADAELVKRGFHIAYLRVPDLFGAPEAQKLWLPFYEELTGKHGLSKKPALIGMSRGGLYCFNWAAAHPDKVSCIWADAAVCDFRSWPGGTLKGLGKGKGSEAEWAKMLKAYGFTNDAQAIAYRGNPVDNLKPIADAKIPLLLVYGDADDLVLPEENSLVVAERYKKLGGPLTVIPKPGIGHHPHSLTNPTPIVEFVMKHAK